MVLNKGNAFNDDTHDNLFDKYSHLSLEERCPSEPDQVIICLNFEDPKNFAFLIARKAACARFFNVVSSRPCLAMHPESMGCIDAPPWCGLFDARLTGSEGQKGGGIGKRVMSVIFICEWIVSADMKDQNF
jgi:hypothetical protein